MPFPNAGLTSKDLCNGAAIERVLGDASVTSVKIAANLESDNYSSGSAGWKIYRDTGNAEFNDITVRGTIYATAGEIGGLSVTGNITMGSGGVIRTASSGERIEVQEDSAAGEDKIKFYTGHTDETIEGSLYVNSSETGGGRVWMGLRGPEVVGTGGQTYIGLFSATDDDSSIPPQILIGYDGSSTQDAEMKLQNDTRLMIEAGSASAPSLALNDSSTTGFYRVGADRLGITLGGTHVAEFNGGKLRTATVASGSPELLFGSSTGSASAPVYSFQGDSDTGMYRSDANVIAWSTQGTARMTLSNTEFTLASGLDYLGQPSTTGSAANGSWQVASGSIYKLQRSTSARKYKRNIDYDTGFLADYELKPAVFYRPDDDAWFIDFIADDLAEQDNRMGVYEGGEVENYHKPSVMAVLAAKVNRLEQEAQAWKNATSR